MDKREILQQIIDNGGNCDWLSYPDSPGYACQFCPLAKLKQRKDGSYMSCWDALVPHGNLWEKSFNPDAAYLNKAIECLQDIMMEDMLKGELDEQQD